jgi:3-phenylpropionate/trans-cinnamate dioxygenase ferredoxin reductase subunit
MSNSPSSSALPLTDASKVFIIGAGQAGLQTAEALRAGGYAGSITMLGDEPQGPYHRPPLSKAWLSGQMELNQLTMRAPETLARKNISLRTGVRVLSIDRTRQLLQLADQTSLPYSHLVLATGSRPRQLSLSGANAGGVLSLRGLSDAEALAQGLARCAAQQQALVVIGGGFIGLEVAATARKQGIAVTVLEVAPRLLGRVLAPMLSDWVAQLHRQQGVDLRLGVSVKALQTDAAAHVCAVELSDGERIPAGLVLVGIGAIANDELAQQSGLECDRGVVVDACGRTSDPHIFAAGDCTARRLSNGQLLRLESVQNATEQGKSAAATLLGQAKPFTTTPWFWSDQYDRKLQMLGLSQGATQSVLRGDMQATGFSLFHFAGSELIGVDSINATKDHMLARKIMDAGRSPSPAQIADMSTDLSAVLKI